MKKILNRSLEPLLADIDSINKEDLYDFSKKTAEAKLSSIKEIAKVQQAFEEMKNALSNSLKAEWEGEQRKRENIRALAHDIKTPLTVIRGNAELLEEDAEDAEELSRAIVRGCDRIQGYISLLMEQSDEKKMSDINSTIFGRKPEGSD